jgi:type II restriction enzyme
MQILTANKGEWSELYVLARLLTEESIEVATMPSSKGSSGYFQIFEIIDRSNENLEVRYTFDNDYISIGKEGHLPKRVSRDQLKSETELFLSELISSNLGSSFQLRSGENLMNTLNRNRISASSSTSSDLHLSLIDKRNENIIGVKGYSIKSEIGNRATLFNASSSTNFIYKIIGTGDLKPFSKVSSVKKNLQELYTFGHTLEFLHLNSQVLQKNLELIDSDLPQILAELLLIYYNSNLTKLTDIGSLAFESKGAEGIRRQLAFKKFLGAASMGLKAGSPWSGYPVDFGGLILVKKHGSIVFYLYENLSLFENYLYENLRFETPSATRHKFGQIKMSNRINQIALNLQIRY